MIVIAQLELMPSFHSSHQWSVELDEHVGRISGKSGGASGQWNLRPDELANVPENIRSGQFPDEDFDNVGLDGISVRFQVETELVCLDKTIWCPERGTCPQYAVLLKWCWEGLYENADPDYRARLEHLYSYFDDWGLPVRRSPEGLRIFGMLSSPQEEELFRSFNEVSAIVDPVIDMSNFENTGTLLYPVFKKFFDGSPRSRWLVNSQAQAQMLEAGIPKSAMQFVGQLESN